MVSSVNAGSAAQTSRLYAADYAAKGRDTEPDNDGDDAAKGASTQIDKVNLSAEALKAAKRARAENNPPPQNVSQPPPGKATGGAKGRNINTTA